MPRIRIVLEALTPTAHFDTRTGVDNATNRRLAMTQPILLNGRRAYAPHVSENAIRTALVRRPLADHLLASLGIGEGELPRPVLSLLYSGGNMGGARAPGDETALGHAIGRLYPSLSLLGGAVDSFILPRSKLRLCACLVAQEYRAAIDALFPEESGRAAAVSVYDLVGDEVRTRGTADRGDNQMLYGYEVLAAGHRLAIELTLDAWTPPAVSAAIAVALAEWDGFLGGQGRQGRGRYRIDSVYGDGVDGAAYRVHLAEHAGAMRAGLVDGTLGQAKVLCAA